MPKTVKRFVLFDVYGWSTPIDGERLRRDYHLARRGEEIEISEAEAARGEGLGALGTEAEATASASAAAEPPSASDEQLGGMNVDELVAYLGQHPSEAQRIIDLEEARERSRKTVLEPAQRVKVAHEEAVADELERQRAATEAEQAAYAAATGGGTGAPTIPA